MKYFIPILLGTGRDGRQSEKVANFVLAESKKREELETQLIDVRDFDFRFSNNNEDTDDAKKWGAIMERACGLIIVSPEYNNGYPGELKLMLDNIYDQYERKPVALCAVSSGAFGGVRMIQNIKPILTNFGMTIVGNIVYFSKVKDLFDDAGKIKDQAVTKRLGSLFNELTWYVKVLKEGRDKYPYEK